jgi:glycosyltransferase involved in cell wall biosynthesis
MHTSNTHARSSTRPGCPLIVHSHLRWDFVWQRPQQLLTRLAAFAPVLFLEEPVFLDDAGDGSLDISIASANVYRAVPRLPAALEGDYDVAIARVRTLAIAELARKDGIGRLFGEPVQWFYTPMPAPAMLGAFEEVGVVYDCMDELSKFRFAHPDLTRRERVLMDSADLVFAGGRTLYESKSRFHPAVHFFGCGVDSDHFAKARDAQTPVPTELGRLRDAGALIAGYYGVIDERLDYELIARLAASDPALHVAMIGPTTKVDAAALPQHPNLHWLGARPYDALPGYVRGFDVCVMPFALNESTEYINPTKTLEYMAAGKPIVSTGIADVVRNFTPIVNVAYDASDFARDALLLARQPDPNAVAAGIALARKSSWDAVVSAMNVLLVEAIETSYRAAARRAKRAVARAADGDEWTTTRPGLVVSPATA